MYQDLPDSLGTAKPILERVMHESAGTVLSLAKSQKRPDPARSIAALGASQEILLSWVAPFRSAGVSGYRVYQDTESNPVNTISDVRTTQLRIKAVANVPTAFYISTISVGGRESIKVQVIGKATV